MAYRGIINVDYLAHHGIEGQKWGKQNGPPYPLDAKDHSAAEKRAGKSGWTKEARKEGYIKREKKIDRTTATEALSKYEHMTTDEIRAINDRAQQIENLRRNAENEFARTPRGKITQFAKSIGADILRGVCKGLSKEISNRIINGIDTVIPLKGKKAADKAKEADEAVKEADRKESAARAKVREAEAAMEEEEEEESRRK